VPTPRTTGWRFDLLHNAAHPVAFGLLGASILLAIRRQEALGPTEALFAFAIATCYGVVDEVHQSVVPGRVCSIADACADMFGAALAIAGMYALLREKRHAVRLLPWLAIGALASVATATWSPC
jgi:VanZ family protein